MNFLVFGYMVVGSTCISWIIIDILLGIRVKLFKQLLFYKSVLQSNSFKPLIKMYINEFELDYPSNYIVIQN